MKVLLTILGLSLLMLGFLLYKAPDRITSLKNIFYYEPCAEPKEYYIAVLDTRFNVSEEEFEKDIAEATALWSNAYGKPLFNYNPKYGTLAVNLFYNRKKLTEAWPDSSADAITQQNMYKQKMTAFQAKLTTFNEQVQQWNDGDKNNTSLYLKLIAQEQALQTERVQLVNMNQSLIMPPDLSSHYTNVLDQAWETLTHNNISNIEEGLYNPNLKRISVYIYHDHTTLKHTIAHELGHALGLEHNPNAQSIMYYESSDTLQLSPEDLADLKEVCKPRTLLNNINKTIEMIPYYLGYPDALVRAY
jgi:matrixin